MTVHPDDDMAHNVLRAQQRDAGYASKVEAEAEWERYLHETGCKWCDETNPEKLSRRSYWHPGCPAIQGAGGDYYIACDGCEAEHGYTRERYLSEQLEHSESGIVTVYECGAIRKAHEAPTDSPYGRPTLAGVCRCGAHIKDVVYAEESQ